MTKTKIKSTDRLCDAVDVTLKDLIVKDLLSNTEKEMYYDSDKRDEFDLFNIYIDFEENNVIVPFNFSIDGEPACDICDKYVMYTLSGKNNETGSDPYKIDGIVQCELPDSIISFEIDTENKDSFSYHKDGYRYSNYVVYGYRKDMATPASTNQLNSKILLAKGKIYMTDVLFDLTENILNGQ